MAAPLALSAVSAVDDIIDAGRFLFLMGTVPGAGDTQSMSVRCFNTSIPGTSSEVFETPMHGFILRYRGRKLQSSPMSVSFWEDSKMSAYDILWNWSEAVSNTETGNSVGYLSDYSITSQLSVFDTTGAEASRFLFYSMFCSDIMDIPLTGEASGPMQLSAQFAYRNKLKVDVGGADTVT